MHEAHWLKGKLLVTMLLVGLLLALSYAFSQAVAVEGVPAYPVSVPHRSRVQVLHATSGACGLLAVFDT